MFGCALPKPFLVLYAAMYILAYYKTFMKIWCFPEHDIFNGALFLLIIRVAYVTTKRSGFHGYE